MLCSVGLLFFSHSGEKVRRTFTFIHLNSLWSEELDLYFQCISLSERIFVTVHHGALITDLTVLLTLTVVLVFIMFGIFRSVWEGLVRINALYL